MSTFKLIEKLKMHSRFGISFMASGYVICEVLSSNRYPPKGNGRVNE